MNRYVRTSSSVGIDSVARAIDRFLYRGAHDHHILPVHDARAACRTKHARL